MGSIMHLRHVNRSQNTEPEVTYVTWQAKPVMRARSIIPR